MTITVTVNEDPTYITVDESNLTVTINQSDNPITVTTTSDLTFQAGLAEDVTYTATTNCLVVMYKKHLRILQNNFIDNQQPLQEVILVKEICGMIPQTKN